MKLVLLFSVGDLVGTLDFQTSHQAVAESRIPEPLALIQGQRDGGENQGSQNRMPFPPEEKQGVFIKGPLDAELNLEEGEMDIVMTFLVLRERLGKNNI